MADSDNSQGCRLTDSVACGVISAVLLAVGFGFEAFGRGIAESFLIWISGSIIGSVGAWAGYAVIRRTKRIIGPDGLGLAIALVAALANAGMLLFAIGTRL